MKKSQFFLLSIMALSVSEIHTSDNKSKLTISSLKNTLGIGNESEKLLFKKMVIKKQRVLEKTKITSDIIEVINKWNRLDLKISTVSGCCASFNILFSGLGMLMFNLTNSSAKYTVTLNSSIEATLNTITLGCLIKNGLNNNHEQNISTFINTLIKNNYAGSSVLNEGQKEELRTKIITKIREEYSKPSKQEIICKLIPLLNFSTTAILSFNMNADLFDMLNFALSSGGLIFSTYDFIKNIILHKEGDINALDKKIKELLDQYREQTV
jgi:hypothetical protein